jgi:hypothetical protein
MPFPDVRTMHFFAIVFLRLIDAIDSLENEPSADVGLAAAELARYVEYIDDMSEDETALLGAAISRSAAGNYDEACSPALAALTSLLAPCP